MNKVIIKDDSKAASEVAIALARKSEFGVFSLFDKGIEAKTIVFVISPSKGGISDKVRKALENFSCSELVGYIAIIIASDKLNLVTGIEAERVLSASGIATSYVASINFPLNEEEIKKIVSDIEKEEIKIPYRFPFSKTIGKITKGLNK